MHHSAQIEIGNLENIFPGVERVFHTRIMRKLLTSKLKHFHCHMTAKFGTRKPRSQSDNILTELIASNKIMKM